MFDGNGSCAEDPVHSSNLGHEDGDDQRDEHCWEEVPVPSSVLAVGERIGLQDAEALVANGQKVEPLDDHQCDEMNALTGADESIQFCLGVAIEPIGVLVVGQEQAIQRNAGLPVHVKEEHGMGAYG